jgi:hypothetical protein
MSHTNRITKNSAFHHSEMHYNLGLNTFLVPEF